MPRPKGSKNKKTLAKLTGETRIAKRVSERNTYAAPTENKMNFATFQSERSAEDMFAGMTAMAAMVAHRFTARNSNHSADQMAEMVDAGEM